MTSRPAPNTDLLRVDPGAEVARIVAAIRAVVFSRFHRRGAVVGASGGIDSTVVAYLCAQALGKERVRLLLMPERESSPDSLRLGRLVATSLGVEFNIEDISSVLEGVRCYERRDAAVRKAVPEYAEGYRCKIVLPGPSDSTRYSIFSVVTKSPEGETKKVRLTPDAYLGIVAATSFKQRVRKMLEYYHADLLQYAVAGTPNRLEHDLGFFVKNGDGAADLKPIAHLYKSQVYQIAAWLGVPEEIRQQRPKTDTYPLEQSQEEFYFTVPLEQMDMCLYGKTHDMSAQELAPLAAMEAGHVERVYQVIESARRVSRYLDAPAVLVENSNSRSHPRR